MSSEDENPEWPPHIRRRTRSIWRARSAPPVWHNESDFDDDSPGDPDDLIPDPPRQLISDHPMGQKIKAESSRPAIILLALCTIMSLWVWGRYPGYEWWEASQAAVFGRGEYWRLLTGMFVHGDIAHLLANSGLFLVFGLMLRQYFGSWAFPTLSIIAGVLTSALSLLTYDPQVTLIGASGMVYCMAAMWLFLFWRHADYLSVLQRSMRSLAFVLVVLVPTQIEPNVSYRTHAIGFGVGLALAWMSSPWLKPFPLPLAQGEESGPI